jgi:hypothetical protein
MVIPVYIHYRATSIELHAVGAAIPRCLSLALAIADALPCGQAGVDTCVQTGSVEVGDEVVPDDDDEVTFATSVLRSTAPLTNIDFSGIPGCRHLVPDPREIDRMRDPDTQADAGRLDYQSRGRDSWWKGRRTDKRAGNGSDEETLVGTASRWQIATGLNCMWQTRVISPSILSHLLSDYRLARRKGKGDEVAIPSPCASSHGSHFVHCFRPARPIGPRASGTT